MYLKSSMTENIFSKERVIASRNIQEAGRHPELLYEIPEDDLIFGTDRKKNERIKSVYKELMGSLVARLVWTLSDERIEQRAAAQERVNPEELKEIRKNMLGGVEPDESVEELARKIETALLMQPDLLEHVKEQVKTLTPYILERAKMDVEKDDRQYIDDMTGGLSKKGIEYRFDIEKERLNKSTAEDECMLLIEFDIDSFKTINDDPKRGHATGDEVIKDVVRVLREILRSSDAVGRRSGDEFSLILNNVKKESVGDIIAKIQQAVESIEDRASGNISVSGGVQIIERNDTLTYETASQQADKAGVIAKIDTDEKFKINSGNLEPDLSTEEKQIAWATKIAERKQKRERGEWEMRKARASTDEERNTAQQALELLDTQLNINIQLELLRLK